MEKEVEKLEEEKLEAEKGEEKKDNKPEKKKSHPVLTTILIILLLIAFFGFGYAIGGTGIVDMVKKQQETQDGEESKEKESTKEEKLEITDEVKENLETFVSVAVAYRSTGMTRDIFIKGTDVINNQTKLEMTNAAIYYNDKVTKNTIILGEEYQNISGVKPDANEMVDTVKIADFDNTYKELFKEEANYNFEDLALIGCPSPVAWNKEIGKFYLLHRCGGTTVTKYENTIASYDSDTKYYYVHQDLYEKNMASNEENTTKLLWKFDKNLKFVSTTVE